MRAASAAKASVRFGAIPSNAPEIAAMLGGVNGKVSGAFGGDRRAAEQAQRIADRFHDLEVVVAFADQQLDRFAGRLGGDELRHGSGRNRWMHDQHVGRRREERDRRIRLQVEKEESVARVNAATQKRLRQASFPYAATIEQFDFRFRPELKRQVVLRYLEGMSERETVSDSSTTWPSVSTS